MSDAASPKRSPTQAAHEAVLELVKASGSDLFKSKGISAESGKNAADFLVAFHKTLTEHYKTLG